MTEQETTDYLKQHFDLYVAEETMKAAIRVQERMVPHLVDAAIQNVADKVLPGWFAELEKSNDY